MQEDNPQLEAALSAMDQAILWADQPPFGTFHSGELPYVFNTLEALDRRWEQVNHAFAAQMMAHWVNFATSGNPNGAGLLVWTSYNKPPKSLMHLGLEPHSVMASSQAEEELWYVYSFLKQNENCCTT